MAAYEVIDYKSIKIEDINLEFPKKIKGGSYFSLASYNNKPIYIQTPRLKCINGIQKNENRCSIELCLDKSHLLFYEFITNIDDYNILRIQENSSAWFKKEFPLDIVEEFYKTPVKLSRNKQAPKLKLKVPLSKGNIACDIYDNNKNITTHDTLKNNDKIVCILQFIGLRFLKQQVICEWNPLQIKIAEPNKIKQPTYLINDSFISDNEDETEEIVVTNTESSDHDITQNNELSEQQIATTTEPIEKDIVTTKELTQSVERFEQDIMPKTELLESIEQPDVTTELAEPIEQINQDTISNSATTIESTEQTVSTDIIDNNSELDDINLELNVIDNDNSFDEILKETQNELNKYKELNSSNELKINEIKNRIQNLFNNI